MVAQFLSIVAILVALLTLHGAASFQPVSNRRQATTSLDAISCQDILAALATAVLVASVPQNALAGDTAASFQGVLKDPKHPKGYHVLVGDVGKKGIMTLQDELGEKVYSIPINSKLDKKTGQATITIDFSVKGGPKDVPATLNADSSLSFPNGNLWKKEG